MAVLKVGMILTPEDKVSRTLFLGFGFTVAAYYRKKIKHLQENGAGNEARTRDPKLGKVVFYP